MSKKPTPIPLKTITAIGVILASTSLARADDIFWIGNNGLWSDSTWDPQIPDGLNGDQTFIENSNVTIKDGIDATSGALIVRNGGTLTMSGGSLVLSGPAYSLVYLAIGDLNSTTGTLTMTGGLIDASDGRIGVGYDENSQGEAVISGGTITHSNEFWVGQGAASNGKLTVSGDAEITGTSWFAIGREGGTGELVVQDSALIDKTNGGNFKIAGDTSSQGTVTIKDSGKFICEAGTMEIGVGSSSTGMLTIQDSGSVETPGNWSIMGGDSDTATLNLNGGSLKTNWIGKSGGTTTINFNGGTLIGQENGTSYLSGFDPADLHILAGGFKFDSNGFDITIVQGLAGSGSLTKVGEGTLRITGANSYTGDTTVSAGILVLSSNDSLADSAAVNLDSADALVLDYDGTDTVGSLIIAGQAQAPGLYTFGTGKLQVGGSTGSAFQTWALSKGLDGTPGKENGPNDDPDHDGRSNLLEFALNGDPLSASDSGRCYALTADSDFTSDPSAGKELILTVAVRAGAPAFTGTPSPAATIDGITYTIEGSQNLSAFAILVHPVSPIVTNLPSAGTGYEYRSFSLDGSDGLAGKGFLRVRVGQ